MNNGKVGQGTHYTTAQGADKLTENFLGASYAIYFCLYFGCYLANYIFVPIAVETFGSWGPRGLKFIKEIGSKIKEKTGNKNATSHIIQAISMTVQRGNATSIMGTR